MTDEWTVPCKVNTRASSFGWVASDPVSKGVGGWRLLETRWLNTGCGIAGPLVSLAASPLVHHFCSEELPSLVFTGVLGHISSLISTGIFWDGTGNVSQCKLWHFVFHRRRQALKCSNCVLDVVHAVCCMSECDVWSTEAMRDLSETVEEEVKNTFMFPWGEAAK